MRQIKFRGLEIGSNKWYYGDLKVFEGVNIGYSFETCHFDEGKVTNYREVEVYPESMGQFTGLNDKNGKEIYEGDILGFFDIDDSDYQKFVNDNFPDFNTWDGKKIYRKSVINWSSKAYGWRMPAQSRLKISFEDVEVIGNIYENPDLLNG